MDTILLATQNPQTRDTVRRATTAYRHIHVVASPDDLWKSLASHPCDCLFIDLAELETLAADMKAENQTQALINRIRKQRPTLGIVVIAANADIRKAVAFMKQGASSYLTEPVHPDEMQLVLDEISRELRQQSELAYLRERLWQEDTRDQVQTDSPLMRKVVDNVHSVAPTKATVLLLGETGTGKSFTARMIHRHSIILM